jgi:hypothetical protein
VIRGGFGISYTPFEDNTYAYNYPVRANNSYQQLNAYQPALLADGSPATFQAGFPAPSPVVIPSNGIIVANTPALLNQAYFVIPQNYHNPYVRANRSTSRLSAARRRMYIFWGFPPTISRSRPS